MLSNQTVISSTWLSRTHPHWLEYRDVIESIDQKFLNFVGIFLTIVGAVGVVGNVTVVLVFCRTPLLRTQSNILIINLAICDLVFSAIIGFPMTALSCFSRGWLWGDFGCDTYAFLAGWTGMGSITCLSFISIDRYMVIVHPLYMLDKKSSSLLTFLKVGTIWSWALVWSVPPLFGWGRYIPEAFGVSCTFDYLTHTWNNISFNYCLFACGFFLPVIIIITCYVGILVEVIRAGRRRRKPMFEVKRCTSSISHCHSSSSHSAAKNNSRSRQELKTAKVLACCFVAFLTCWTPYAVVAQLGINGAEHLITPYASEVPVLFAKTSSIWNPLIYALSNPGYRRAVIGAFRHLHSCMGRRDGTASTTASVRHAGKLMESKLNCSSESLMRFKMFHDNRTFSLKSLVHSRWERKVFWKQDMRNSIQQHQSV